jgi:sec-independent protein translocase protein TatA
MGYPAVQRGGTMPSLGPTELIVILFIVIVLFGVGKVGDIGGALGKSVREFRKSVQDDDSTAKRPPVQGEGGTSQKV